MKISRRELSGVLVWHVTPGLRPAMRRTLRLAFWLAIGLAGTGGQAEPPDWASEMLTAHNTVRARIPIAPLKWSARLASYSQEWANSLLAHKRFSHRPKSAYGENLFEITNAAASPGEVVNAWASESNNYNYRSNRCRADCGHYTQIVWADTKEVGCGVARSRRREIWVCDYNPPGNWVGRRPY